ncbi:MAG: DUF2970 domain-containing protein [Ramlibacter sp.]|jgi:hypothetical protein|uniref:DUF2970 domain-containing protein n=1 Tax=Ramlibacter sp. TaxID=1917967 RepID=UPI00261648FA|nr:DUF2970 domain-containing protein [Ramlibacter sp.]MDH4377919.1 DUF2970 domain-containing protein [Ramlibacter sp.]
MAQDPVEGGRPGEAVLQRRGSLLQTLQAVGWAFLGVRKNADYQRDMGRLNPLHVVLVALIAVGLFVGGLVALVHWIV